MTTGAHANHLPVDDGVHQDLDGVLVCQQVDDLKGVLDDADLLKVVAYDSQSTQWFSKLALCLDSLPCDNLRLLKATSRKCGSCRSLLAAHAEVPRPSSIAANTTKTQFATFPRTAISFLPLLRPCIISDATSLQEENKKRPAPLKLSPECSS
jgi:hypothetical protein